MDIKIMSRIKAVEHSYKGNIPSCVIISIRSFTGDDINYTGKPSFYRHTQIKDILYLQFDDVETEQDRLKGYRFMSVGDAHQIKDFVDKWNGKVDEIIVHCFMGQSRSSAVASGICRYIGLGDKWIWNNSKYDPNLHVINTLIKVLNIKYK